MNTAYIKNAAIILAAVLLLCSCEKDVKVDLPDYPPQLTIYSTNTTYPNSSLAIVASVGKSISILKYNGKQELSVFDAKVDLYKDGNFIASMIYDPGSNNLISSVIPEAGKTYTIKASAPGYPDVAEATAKAMMEIPIRELSYIPFARNGANGSEDEVTITFDDPAGEKNYYMITFLSPGTDDQTRKYYSNICVNTLDPSIETISSQEIFSDDNNCLYGDLFLKDELFEGQTKKIKFYVSSYNIQPYENPQGDTVYSHIQLTHISEDYYRYRKTAAFASENQGNPFAEPTNVYTNVKNGRGIFSISMPYAKEIRE